MTISYRSPYTFAFALSLATSIASCEESDSQFPRLDAAAVAHTDPPACIYSDAGTNLAPVTSVADVDFVELRWSSDVDVGHLVVNDVSVLPDGSAWCYQTENGVQVLSGRLDTPDPPFQTLLAGQGVVARLISPCLLRLADAGPYVTTSLGAGNTKVTRLMFGSCLDDALKSVRDALSRIGDACIEQATPVQTQ